MAISNKIVLRVLLAIAIGFLLLFGFVIFSILYESKKDISTKMPFAKVLNIPQEVKRVSTIRWNKNNLRFSNYALVVNEASYYNEDDVKSVKIYEPGDKITFHAAKTYYSIHVDRTYYLIGRDTLDTGEVIEFEYYYSPSNTAVLWR
ncbi:hypothetical protein [Lacinutrix chionoecetis]